MDLGAYLNRFGYDGPRTPDLETLRAMHRAHFYAVPFENLDIQAKRRIEVDESVNFEKVVTARRGGFCLELNGMYARALRQLGYNVDVLAARVVQPDGRLSEPFTHMTLVVHLDEPWLVDVGFGSRIPAPLRLRHNLVQQAEGRTCVLAHDADRWFMTVSEPGSAPSMYTFTMQPREFAEYQTACDWLQTSPDSRFTHGPVITLPTPAGRKTLAGTQYIVTSDGERDEREISEAEIPTILREEFGVMLATE